MIKIAILILVTLCFSCRREDVFCWECSHYSWYVIDFPDNGIVDKEIGTLQKDTVIYCDRTEVQIQHLENSNSWISKIIEYEDGRKYWEETKTTCILYEPLNH
jgi:hypothetical protein